MVQTISAEKITLYDLEQKFGLKQADDPAFFKEWQSLLPVLSPFEQERLTRIKASYANLERRAVLENTIKLAVVAPLLDLAGFFLPPFYVSTEDSIELVAQEHNTLIRGRIDVLVLKEQLWILVIEAKRADFSLKVGIPQVLSYMLAAPQAHRPLYGLVTNGSNFVFVKLVLQPEPQFAKSQEFVLDRGDDLSSVLIILKALADQVA